MSTVDNTKWKIGDLPASVEFKMKIRGEEWTFKLCSPDDVNEVGRNAGLPVQAASLTLRLKNTVLIAWPPSNELGMDLPHIMQRVVYEVVSNVLLLEADYLG